MPGAVVDSSPNLPPPAPASVVPRVRAAPDGASLPLELHVRRMLDAKLRGTALVRAPVGGGKTAALAHLRFVLPADADIDLFDEPPAEQLHHPDRVDRLTIAAVRDTFARRSNDFLANLTLVQWTEDDLVEYLARTHRDRCASTLARIRADGRRDLLEGSPRLWRIVLDELAADDSLPDSAAALRKHLLGLIPSLHRSGPVAIPAGAARLLEHALVRIILDAEELLYRIERHDDAALYASLGPELIAQTAAILRHRPGAIKRLNAVFRKRRERRSDSACASLLLATDALWRPKRAANRDLSRASLANAQWSGLDLRSADLRKTDFRGSNLSSALLDKAQAESANFRACNLANAAMFRAHAEHASFCRSDLSRLRAVACKMTSADFSSATLADAIIERSTLVYASFQNARLLNTKLHNCNLGWARFDDAELLGVDFTGSILSHVQFSTAEVCSGMRFSHTSLLHCDLEGLRLAGANFEEAVLTGSLFTETFIPRGNFAGVKLINTGLAGINWEGADLRDADLTGATFHLGSSRSGLVGSVIPCEGSKTGFYTDDYNDQDFKQPEEIRKANLRDANLLGANVSAVDFYLVDLRGAKYTPEQGLHFRRCGAILDPSFD